MTYFGHELTVMHRASIVAEAREKLENAQRKRESNGKLPNGQQPPDFRRMVANVKAPYVEGSGDPCLPACTSSAGTNDTTHASQDVEISIALKTAQQLEEYDRRAIQTKDYYVKALERLRGQRSSMNQSSDPRRRPTG